MKKDTVIIDIDGILADYRLGLLYWIRQSCPELAQAANQHLKRTDTWINHTSMSIGYVEWLNVLEMFRMSGGKRSIPVFDGAQRLFQFCHKSGFDIILLTSRPIDLYSNIYRDTVEWLRDNKFEYRMLLWSKSKAEMVHRMRLTERTLFAIDDEANHVKDYINLGIRTYWIKLYSNEETNQDWVKYWTSTGRLKIFNSLLEFVERIEK